MKGFTNGGKYKFKEELAILQLIVKDVEWNNKKKLQINLQHNQQQNTLKTKDVKNKAENRNRKTKKPRNPIR